MSTQENEKQNYVFLAEGFEEIEALTVVDILRRAGLNCRTVSIKKDGDLVVTGSHNIPVTADISIDKITPDSIHSLILPGGMPGTSNLKACEPLKALIQEAYRNKYHLAAICAGPTVLAELGLLKGVKAVCYPTSEEILAEAGAIVQRVETITDGNITTSRGMGTAIAFSLELVRIFQNEEAAANLQSKIVYRQ